MNNFIIRYSSLGRRPHWFSYIPRRRKPIQIVASWPFSQLEVWQEHKDACVLRFIVKWKEPKVFHTLDLPDKAIRAFTQELLDIEQEFIYKIMNLEPGPDITVL